MYLFWSSISDAQPKTRPLCFHFHRHDPMGTMP